MTEDNLQENLTIGRDRVMAAGVYTLTFLSVPLIIYGNNSLFKSFCSFHTRVLKLDSKSPGQVVGLSLIMSIVYSSISFPVFYSGLLHILGLDSAYDIQGIFRKSTERTYKKYPKMKEIDEKILYELDKTFGINAERTKKFIEESFGDDFSSKPK